MLRTVVKVAALVAVLGIIGHQLADPDLGSVLLGLALGMSAVAMFPGLHSFNGKA